MSQVGTFSDFSVKSYGPLTNTSLKIWKFPKSHNYRSRPKNQTSWKLAQNNVWFFVLPSTTRYQCVLLWRKNSKKLKHENLNWHWSCPKERADPRRSKSAKKFIFNNLFKILLIMFDLKTQLVTSASCPGQILSYLELMSDFSFKSYSRSTETSFFPWKSRKIKKSLFLGR